MKVYDVNRVLTFATGEAIALPFNVYDDEEVAKGAGEAATKKLGELMRMGVIGMRYVDPEGQPGLRPVMGVNELVRALSISEIRHVYLTRDVHQGAVLTLPEKKIVVPGTH